MNSSSFFNSLDYFYIIIMLMSSAFGFVKGFTRSFLSLCTWVGSGFISAIVAPYLYPLMKEYFKEESIVQGVSTTVAYVLILIAFTVITHFISDRIKSSILSGLDRAMGVLFGLLRGVFFPLCVCTTFLIFDIAKDRFESVNKSKISHILFKASEVAIVPYLKKDETIKKIKEQQEAIIKEHQKSAEEAVKASKFKIVPKEEPKEKKKSVTP